ncbi:MAG: Maf family nucleotide pyrophosphatase [Desulfuromonadaceae bacterium]|nr:Maf family nucleotide pyrophosphatase [Desulfuromonadaceae bacterium]MDD2848441.1 Maf family nucleotide pyrophosphatase [Desulfuromonadaceae bacterium]MDD4129930.1 Maf family nucleotide pyrophosphatase [Desulfuromonadaceae bacterium]
MKNDHKIVLASASPRRTELMELAGISFSVVPADICEDVLPGELPADHVIRLSREKADAVATKHDGRFFIGADTIVVLDGAILGKPVDAADARRMLSGLSGRDHEVITGFSVFDKASGVHISRSVRTEVTFKKLTEKEITAYIATGCPMDKAGAYAIQGGAVHFVRSINGSYTNVIGLPMTELYEVLLTMQAID